MSQKLFEEEEKVEKKVQVRDIEQNHSLLDKIFLPKFSVNLPELSILNERGLRETAVVAVEILLLTYLALGYAGLVPLF